MDKEINEKMETLLKYVPFIDFLLKIDKQKYIKFINIRKWIVLKRKKYPLSDLNKIEQSIITQYKNLLVDDKVLIPQNISNIFAPLKFKEYVDLCSDDEDDDNNQSTKESENQLSHIEDSLKTKIVEENHNKNVKRNPKWDSCENLNINAKSSTSVDEKPKSNDNDDDLEIISIDYIEKPKDTPNQPLAKASIGTIKENLDLDDVSRSLLNKIDKLAEDELKIKNFYEPNNYTYQQSDAAIDSNTAQVEGEISQRGDSTEVLFKRRADFKDDEVVVEKLDEEFKEFYCNKIIETISLDSCSDDELYNDDPSTSKTNSNKNKQNIVNQCNTTEKTNSILKENALTVESKEDIDSNVASLELPHTANNLKKYINPGSVEKIDTLCNSTDSAFIDKGDNLNDLLNEIKTNRAKDDPRMGHSAESSNKENDIQPTSQINNRINDSYSRSHEEMFKIIEDVSINTDIEVDTILRAFENVKEMNFNSIKDKTVENNSANDSLSETPPPAPPVIHNIPTTSITAPLQQSPIVYPVNVVNPTIQSYNPHIQPIPQQTKISNCVPTPVLPPRTKINIKDPRIMKQLHTIQNSPLFKFNLLNPEITTSIMNICRSQAGQQKVQPPQQQPQQIINSTIYQQNIGNKSTNTTTQKANNTGSRSSISYGEYKRRKIEMKLKMERLREEKRAKSEKLKVEELRSKILSTLTPCKDQITSLWNQQKSIASTIQNIDNVEKNGCSDSNVNDISIEEKNTEESNKDEMSFVNKGNNKSGNNETKANKNKKTNCDDKLNRIYKELECTVKGFDQIHDYLPKATEDKRKSSIQARKVIKKQLHDNSLADCLESTPNTFLSKEEEYAPRSNGLKRRCSIHALSAISEQLSDRPVRDENSVGLKRRFTEKSVLIKDVPFQHVAENDMDSSTYIISQSIKRSKTLDESIKPPKKTVALRIESSESPPLEENNKDIEEFKKSIIKNPPFIRLKRMSEDFIRKHIKRNYQEHTENLLNVHLVQLTDKLDKIQKTVESAKKTANPQRFNNDCQMTERNTRFCVLCTAKPSNLTNHYIRKHKTESYVSRLDWSELDDLIINTPFAKLQPQTANSRINRYLVECPFCKEQLVEPFMNLYNHYSSHTGEYAYNCSHCHLLKPYRADIQSHILHSKTCRNSYVQVMYRYPPDAQCIYLHYCNICNFVQLNEANIVKHIREQHDKSQATATNVSKCILAAISDGPDVNSSNQRTPSPQLNASEMISKQINENNITLETNAELKFKVDDNDVPVGNEPCSEDVFEEYKYSLQEQLKLMHEYPANINTPMTVIHYTKNILKDSPRPEVTEIQSIVNTTPQRHLPMIIKSEAVELNDNILVTSPKVSDVVTRSSNNNQNDTHSFQKCNQGITTVEECYTTYEKYRCYPDTVNYLGLYKCMIDDCYYSTDCSEEILKHLANHFMESTTNEYLQCPYCIISTDNMSLAPIELVEHVRRQHQHMNYQCSICCYRSCEASNVFIHQRSHHGNVLNSCKIYKCSSSEENISKTKQTDLNQLITKNVYKISCNFCHTSFYNSNLLVNHLISVHNISDTMRSKFYSCIYCPLTSSHINKLRIHVAAKHPGEIPYIYDHNGQVNKNEDSISSLNIINLCESVQCIEVKSAVFDKSEESVSQDPKDIKPNLKELQQMNEETIRVRLQKLTAHTGIAPDNLYRCPKTMCGGFFSIFESWLKHMKLRHYALECECPHCNTDSSPTMHSLESFSTHFEEHRRHTFLCFYCSDTSSNEQMALQHASMEHANFGPMRFEQIRFNINYSYSIMIQNSLFTEREDFISEFLIILEKRLKDMETIEKQKLKHQWALNDNVAWLEDYPKMLLSRKVTLRCLMRECSFRTASEDILFKHMRASHDIKGNKFCCAKCNYRLEKFDNLDEVYNHIKLHSDSIFICTACSSHSSSRSKISTHIRKEHAARDVPVVQVFKINQQIFNKLYIVFSNDHITFSTMKNCFCCGEKNMSGNVFNLHLKRYHRLVLNYYCEWCINFPFKFLEEIKTHYQQFHPTESIKVRCELAANKELCVTSLNEFQVQISKEEQEQYNKFLNIKEEPNDLSDDAVILLEDDDIIIEKSLKNGPEVAEKPKLKCKSLNNLMATTNNKISPTTFQSYLLPQIISTNHNAQLYPQSSTSALHPLSISSNGYFETQLPNTNITTSNAINTFNNQSNVSRIATSVGPSITTNIPNNATILNNSNNGTVMFHRNQANNARVLSVNDNNGTRIIRPNISVHLNDINTNLHPLNSQVVNPYPNNIEHIQYHFN